MKLFAKQQLEDYLRKTEREFRAEISKSLSTEQKIGYIVDLIAEKATHLGIYEREARLPRGNRGYYLSCRRNIILCKFKLELYTTVLTEIILE